MNSVISKNPFVGLRPFEIDESLLFFGRQEQTIELLQRLHRHHFVGIVGSSGCGKSSLIRAGLIPSLKAGYLVNDRDKWMTPIFKPGEGPLYNFANAVLSEMQKDNSPASVKSFVDKIEKEGADAIIDLLQPVYNENRINIFILVDQFEELFRFSIESKDAAKKDEAIDFVNILLELVDNTTVPMYVVITMRSDFIGDCSQFFGLPEALNKSQYLVPRPTREQLKNAIEGPIRLYGETINPALTTKLLNDVQTVKDELPLLQHSLMRIWDQEMKTGRNGVFDLDDYIAIGGIEKALSQHADEALAVLSDEEKYITELIFQALTSTDYGGRKIRRPAHLNELTNLTGADSEAIYKIINHFNDDKRCFLVINKSIDAENPLIDISHESLIRQWETLVEWVDKETESAKNYRRLSEAATLNKEGKKDLISGAELQVAVNWQKKQNPNAAWAARYNNSYEETLLFLEKSKQQAREERNKKRIRKFIYGFAALLLFAVSVVSFWFRAQTKAAQESEKEALRQSYEANRQKKIANYERQVSDSLRMEANRKTKLAEKAGKMSEMSRIEALKQKELAENARQMSEMNRIEALEAKTKADRAYSEARKQERKALAKADSIRNLLDAITSQEYYATADSIAKAKAKALTEKALKNINTVISQTSDTASIDKLKSITNELEANINPEKNNDKLIHSVTTQQVQQVMPKASAKNVTQFVEAFNKVMDIYEINTTNRIAAFLAQVAYETGELYYLEEVGANAGSAYEGRLDLGNTQPGDGIKYNGRGLFMLVGRSNYSTFSNPPKYDLVNHPELLRTVDVATDVACRYWQDRKLNKLADKEDLPSITKKIRGGTNGLQARSNYYFKAKQVFGK
ncbi:hypothetical protein [Runella sp.]|uniref:nSTAND1 domain-containing NTPase n=1 Tax=Runella sp. TaxID=1960881 RepID=UPI003D0E3C47